MNQEDAVPQIDWGRADLLIELALNEDLDTTGDVTTASVVPEEATATAGLTCKEPKMVQAGIQIAERLFKMVEPRLQIQKPLLQPGVLVLQLDRLLHSLQRVLVSDSLYVVIRRFA